MKKVKKFIKSNIKVGIAFILGLVIAGSIGVYAATVINASAVSFSGSTTGLKSTNMQDALDEAYSNAIEEYECSTPGTTSDNGYFCSVYSEKCATTTYGTGTPATSTYYFPASKYNITILTTLDDISDFLYVMGNSFIAVPTSSVSSSTISKFSPYYTMSSQIGGSAYGISLALCKSHSYYWKKL